LIIAEFREQLITNSSIGCIFANNRAIPELQQGSRPMILWNNQMRLMASLPDEILTQAISHTNGLLSTGEISPLAARAGLQTVVASICGRWPERAEWSRARLRQWVRASATSKPRLL
jgi:hypothetical protein